MPHSRVHDLLFLLAGSLLSAGCTERGSDMDDGGEGAEGTAPDPDEQAALDDALEACKPYARKVSACYAEAYEGEYAYGYVAQVGSCIAQVGYYAADSPDCADAFIDYFACLAELDCDTLLGDGAGPHPCDPSDEALETACDFGEDDSVPGDPGSDT
ncbi:MAG: hypothetical protein IAG13_03125 [Deltaproteobacteria bacterium]|nr:hypothetical protein [Nannocystaceae bacterium]